MKLQHKGDYRQRRAEAYPGIEEQLDMLWWAMDSDALPKAEPFYSTIRQVKQRFPKSPA